MFLLYVLVVSAFMQKRILVNHTGGKGFDINTSTKMTKMKLGILIQNKHKKRLPSEVDQSDGAFDILFRFLRLNSNRILR